MSAPMGEVSRALKDALFEALSSILSPIQDVRISAEKQISVLEVTDGKLLPLKSKKVGIVRAGLRIPRRECIT